MENKNRYEANKHRNMDEIVADSINKVMFYHYHYNFLLFENGYVIETVNFMHSKSECKSAPRKNTNTHTNTEYTNVYKRCKRQLCAHDRLLDSELHEGALYSYFNRWCKMCNSKCKSKAVFGH